MKNQDLNNVNSQQNNPIIVEDSLIKSVDTLNQSFRKCKGGKGVIYYCMNQKCKVQSVFTCQNNKCVCVKKHKKCHKNMISYTLGKIVQKIKEKQNLKSKFTSLIDKSIQTLNQLKKTINQQIQNQTLVLLSKIEVQFYQLFINQQKKETFNALDLLNMCKIVWKQEQQKQKRIFAKINQQMKIFQASIVKSTNILLDQVFQKVNRYRIVSKSSIIGTNQNYVKMKQLFNRKVNSMKLLYKASECDFDLQKYYQLFGQQTDTIIVCRTDKDKIIGGYTPLKFNPNPNKSQNTNQQVKYPSNSTFLFSLTTGDKFPLIQYHESMIRPDKNGYIYFGNGGFSIMIQANRLSNGGFCLGDSCFDFLHYKDNSQSNLIINGNQNHTFCVKQLQVIQVKFQNDSI